MIAQSTRYAICLGLAGSFAVAIAPAVRAQIPVTGGTISGQAAFFVPTPGGSGTGVGVVPTPTPVPTPAPTATPAPGESTVGVQLFDIGISQLRLETPNGNTSTAVFTPTAASYNAGSDNQPNAGDTGTVQGLLSGIAFPSGGGTPIPFSNRETILNFTVSNFSANAGVIDGTLISPQQEGTAPLVFLPDVEATLESGSSFEATQGELQVGDLNADLDDGLIDLPSSYSFSESGGTTVTPAALARTIKFSFEGENVTPDDGTDLQASTTTTGGGNGNNGNGNSDDGDSDDGNLGNGNSDDGDSDDGNLGNGNSDDDDTDTIRFVGEVNKKFVIETVSTSGEQFKIEGNVAAVDVSISGPFTINQDDGLDETLVIDSYKIEGQSEGIGSLYALNSLGFSSTGQSSTQFTFQQGNETLAGSSTGPVSLYAVAGATQFNRDTNFTNYSYTTYDSGSSTTTSMCNTCGTTLVNNSTVTIGGTTVTVGSPIIIDTGSGSGSGGSTSGGSGSGSGSGGSTSGGSGSGSGSGGSASGGSGSGSGSGGSASGGSGSGGSASGGSGFGGGASGGSASGGGASGSGTSSTSASGNAVNVNVFSLGGTSASSTANVQYQLLASSNIRIVSNISGSSFEDTSSDDTSANENFRTRVRLVQRGGKRYYVVTRQSLTGLSTISNDDQDQSSSGSTTSSGSQGQSGSGSTASSGSQGQSGSGSTASSGSQGQSGSSSTASSGSQGQSGSSSTASSGSQGQSGSGSTASSGSQGQSGSGSTASSGSQGQSGSGSTAFNDDDQEQTGTTSTASSDDGQEQTGTTSTASSDDDQELSGSNSTASSDDDQEQSSTTSAASSDDDQEQTGTTSTASSGSQSQSESASTTSSSSQETAYELVGPSSRCFPGLVGLKQIPAEEVSNISNENTNNTASTQNVNNDNATSSTQAAAQ